MAGSELQARLRHPRRVTQDSASSASTGRAPRRYGLAMPVLFVRDRNGDAKPNRARRLLIGAAVLLEVAALWLRTGQLGGNVAVRCRQGHVFTTIWIPAVSVKSLRLWWWRLQYCPVGRHWSIVTPVRQSDLSEQERLSASENTDIRLP